MYSPLANLSAEHFYVKDIFGNLQSGGWIWFAEYSDENSKVRYIFRGRRSTFAKQVQISWQKRHFRKVRYRFRSVRNASARAGNYRFCGAGAGAGAGDGAGAGAERRQGMARSWLRHRVRNCSDQKQFSFTL